MSDKISTLSEMTVPALDDELEVSKYAAPKASMRLKLRYLYLIVLGGRAIGTNAAGALVGTNDTQTLTNKTLTNPFINGVVALASGITSTLLNQLVGLSSSITATILNRLSTLRSDVQVQIDAKLDTAFTQYMTQIYRLSFMAAATSYEVKESDILTYCGISGKYVMPELTAAIYEDTGNGLKYLGMPDTNFENTSQVSAYGQSHLEKITFKSLSVSKKYRIAIVCTVANITGV